MWQIITYIFFQIQKSQKQYEWKKPEIKRVVQSFLLKLSFLFKSIQLLPHPQSMISISLLYGRKCSFRGDFFLMGKNNEGKQPWILPPPKNSYPPQPAFDLTVGGKIHACLICFSHLFHQNTDLPYLLGTVNTLS